MLLIEQTAIAPDGSAAVLTAGTGSAFMTKPTETPPNVVYPARLLNSFRHERYCWSASSTTGRMQISVGALSFANSDGALDYWMNYAVDGQPIVIRRGADSVGENGNYPSDYPILFSGSALGFTPSWGTLTLNISDALGLLIDLPLQQSKFLGSNIGSAGVEGLVTDLRGNPKPKLRGWVQNFQPTLVNAQALVYQVDDGTATLPMALKVYVGGLTVTAGSALTSLAALITPYPTWAQSQVVAIGAQWQAGGNVYTCTKAGTTLGSGAGPTGAGSGIVDGTAAWNYLRAAPTATMATFSAWAISTLVLLGVHTIANSNLYVCTVAGTTLGSGAGPSGVGAGITDNTVTWNYVSAANNITIYDWYAGPEGWFFRMGFTAGLQVTCDVSEGAASDRTIGQIVRRILTNEGGLVPSLLSGVSALDAAQSGEVGNYAAGQTTIGAFLDPILSSGNCYLTDTLDGRAVVGRLEDPETQTSVAAFAAWQILAPQGLQVSYSSDQGVGLRVGSVGLDGHVTDASYANQGTSSGLPVWRVLLDYAQNKTVQNQTAVPSLATSGVAGAMRAALLLQSCATIEYADPTGGIKALHAKAPEFGIQTVFRYQNDAWLEAIRQFNMRSRVNVIVQVPLRIEDAQAVDLGQTFTLALPRFGWDAGRKFTCIGIVYEGGAPTTPQMMTLIGWGKL